MSHTTTHKQVVNDIDLFLEIASEQGHVVTKFEQEQYLSLYGTNTVKGIASVQLKGWKHQLIITKDRQIKYDAYCASDYQALPNLLNNYNEAMIIQNIPMDIVSNYYFETNQQGEKQLIVEYE
jgi:hypothetical protein